ncbi:hypothetical protein GCM10023222_21040 [Saccharopolyspora cebuensis]
MAGRQRVRAARDEALRRAGRLVEEGVDETVRTGTATTDRGGSAGTTAFAAVVAETIRASACSFRARSVPLTGQASRRPSRGGPLRTSRGRMGALRWCSRRHRSSRAARRLRCLLPPDERRTYSRWWASAVAGGASPAGHWSQRVSTNV